MKNRIHRGGSMNAFVWTAMVASSFLGSACSNQVSDGKSGETHFFCSNDEECTRHFGNDDYYCGAQKYCTPRADGGKSHDDGGQSGSDGTPGEGGNGGTAAGGAGGTNRGDFASCKTPPNSTCSEAQTCAALGCPNLQYDEHACLRPQCDKDDDCAADERCAMNKCESSATCTVQGGMCQCASLAICGEVPRCNSTATTGPRGEWVSLDVTQVNSLGGTAPSWHVTPDGNLTTSTAWAYSSRDAGAPVQTMLDVGQMFSIVGAVRGPDLRLAMRDGLPCASTPGTDLSVKFSLKLSTQTMTSGEVSGCINGDNVYGLIYNVLSQAGAPPGGSDTSAPPQAAVTFSSVPAPGKACTHTTPQISLPSKYNAGVQAELSCDPSLGCQPDDYVVANGDRGSTVSCSVVPNGGSYNVQLSLLVDGSATNDLSGQFSATGVVSDKGGMLSIQENNSVANGGGSQQDCTVTIAPPSGVVQTGKIWASFECPAFRDRTDIGETGCDLSGRFLFENCAH